jgi:hypothetical protein
LDSLTIGGWFNIKEDKLCSGPEAGNKLDSGCWIKNAGTSGTRVVEYWMRELVALGMWNIKTVKIVGAKTVEHNKMWISAASVFRLWERGQWSRGFRKHTCAELAHFFLALQNRVRVLRLEPFPKNVENR